MDQTALWEAAISGNVESLNILIEKDQLILDRISLTFFTETPLHIAALRGHLNFVRAVLSHKPKLDFVLDSFRRSALHLAFAEGHVEIVQELLNTNSKSVLHVRDQDGRTPLQLATMNEHIDVIKILIQEEPELARETMENGETILHLCVKHNCFEALKFLVEWLGDDYALVSSKNDNGNTILHLAVALKQMETIKYLLSKGGGIFINANAVNENGFTALDVLEHSPRDFKALEIRQVLVEAGSRRAKELLQSSSTPAGLTIASMNAIEDHRPNDISQTCSSKAKELMLKVWNRFIKSDSSWFDEARGNLMVAATVTASMAFQAGLNPPGGVWQETMKTQEDGKVTAGYSIAATRLPSSYNIFLKFNTVSLVMSLSTILLMLCGLPLKNKFCTWLLMITMFGTLAFIVLSYLVAIYLISAENETIVITEKVSQSSLRVWIGLCAAVALLHTIRVLAYMARKFKLMRILLGLVNKLRKFLP